MDADSGKAIPPPPSLLTGLQCAGQCRKRCNYPKRHTMCSASRTSRQPNVSPVSPSLILLRGRYLPVIVIVTDKPSKKSACARSASNTASVLPSLGTRRHGKTGFDIQGGPADETGDEHDAAQGRELAVVLEVNVGDVVNDTARQPAARQ